MAGARRIERPVGHERVDRVAFDQIHTGERRMPLRGGPRLVQLETDGERTRDVELRRCPIERCIDVVGVWSDDLSAPGR